MSALFCLTLRQPRRERVGIWAPFGNHVGSRLERIDVHHPSQPVSQAASRGRRHRRRLCGESELASGTIQPCGIRGISRGACKAAVRLARGPASRRRAGLLHEEAVAICESTVGTIKSRISRAGTWLSELLSIDSPDRFGPGHTTRVPFSDRGAGARSIGSSTG